jgi:hypothetical protein
VTTLVDKLKQPRTTYEWLNLTLLIACFLIVALIPILISWNRRFEVDEIEHIYASYSVAQGRLLYKDIWQGHHPLLYHLCSLLIFKDDPSFSYRAARALMLCFFAGQVLLACFAAFRLGGGLAARITATVLMLQTVFCNRGLDVRPEVPSAFCITASFALLLSRFPPLTVHVIQALLLSAGFLFSQKAALACPVFAGWWLLAAWRQRRPTLLLAPLLVWCVPVAAYALYMVEAGNFWDYWANVVRSATPFVTREATFVGDVIDNSFILRREIPHNVFYAVGLILGIPSGLWSWRTRPKLAFGACLCLTLAMSLKLNPFPYAYNYLAFIPTGSVLIGVLVADWAGRWRITDVSLRSLALLLACTALSGATAVPFLVENTRPAWLQRRQLETLTEVSRVTAPDDAVFDQMGMYFRPNGHWQYVLNLTQVQRFEQGKSRYTKLEEEIAERQVVAIILNYRTAGLAQRRPLFADFVKRHFVHYDGNIWLQGIAIENLSPDETRSFDALKTKSMIFQGVGEILLDGKPFVAGLVTSGRHTISATGPSVRGKLILAGPLPSTDPPREPTPLYSDDEDLRREML